MLGKIYQTIKTIVMKKLITAALLMVASQWVFGQMVWVSEEIYRYDHPLEFFATKAGQSPTLGVYYIDYYLIVQVAAGNLCGESNFYYQYVIRPPMPGCPGKLLIVSPNPTSSNVEIKVVDSESSQVESALSGNILITDNAGNMKHSSIIQYGEKTIDVSSFNSGTYQVVFPSENLSINTTFIKNYVHKAFE